MKNNTIKTIVLVVLISVNMVQGKEDNTDSQQVTVDETRVAQLKTKAMAIPFPLPTEEESAYVLRVDAYEDIDEIIELYIQQRYEDYKVFWTYTNEGLFDRKTYREVGICKEGGEDEVKLRFDITDAPPEEIPAEIRKKIDRLKAKHIAKAKKRMKEQAASPENRLSPEEKAKEKQAIAEWIKKHPQTKGDIEKNKKFWAEKLEELGQRRKLKAEGKKRN